MYFISTYNSDTHKKQASKQTNSQTKQENPIVFVELCE